MKIDVSPFFQQVRVGTLSLRNRFILPGMQRGLGNAGTPTPEMAEYYRRRTEAGVALIISESTAIDHPSASSQRFCVRINATTLDGWKRCVDAVRSKGGEFFIQLWHEGAHRPERDAGPFSFGPSISPSGLATPSKGHGRPAALQQLAEIKDAFVRSALMAKEVGASGVEVHGAHGYLLDQFLWAATNQRDDEYGGEDLRHRMRFPCEVVSAIREAVGSDFPISFRFSQWKEVDFDARIAETSEELRIFVEGLECAGVDMLHASTRRFSKPEWHGDSSGLAGWTKRFASVPVVTVGSVGIDKDLMQTFMGAEVSGQVQEDLEDLLRRLAADEFDMIAVGRSLIGDANWVEKVRSGRIDEIKPFTRKDIVGDMEWDQEFVAEAHGSTS